jgi:cytochrome c-type biogenesis protein
MAQPVGEPVSVLMAFGAGLLSFVSPCVLPIVPGYLSFISGINMAEFRDGQPAPGLARRVTITSLFFVLGFSTIFVALGATATLVGYYLQEYKRTLGMVGGAVIIVLGLHLTGILPIKWLLFEKRAEMRTRPMGLLGAYVVGLAFAFGWTPCIGPILAMILAMAAQQDTVLQGVFLLAVYSAGLGIPFLLSALAINRFFAAFTRLRRHLRVVEYVAGGLLIGVGLLLLTDRLTVLSNYFAKLFPFLPTG